MLTSSVGSNKCRTGDEPFTPDWRSGHSYSTQPFPAMASPTIRNVVPSYQPRPARSASSKDSLKKMPSGSFSAPSTLSVAHPKPMTASNMPIPV